MSSSVDGEEDYYDAEESKEEEEMRRWSRRGLPHQHDEPPDDHRPRSPPSPSEETGDNHRQRYNDDEEVLSPTSLPPSLSRHDKTMRHTTGDAPSPVEPMPPSPNQDLFVDIGNAGHHDPPPARHVTPPSRLSLAAKRRSLPVDNACISARDAQLHVDRYRGGASRASFHPDDASSFSALSRPSRLSSRLAGASSAAPRPDDGRPPSRGSVFSQSKMRATRHRPDPTGHSPRDALSDPKHSQGDSASAESETAETVWDELDDLKSRIKKLEWTGKLPTGPGRPAVVASADTAERPRTATTAPTTIDSSPKRDAQRSSHPDAPPNPTDTPVAAPTTTTDSPLPASDAATHHPLLHSALAKARPLLSPALYRTLEATAADALHLALMTAGGGHPPSSSPAPSDRHVRRKADAMCRNLTDLCLTLCDGKPATPSVSVTASPVAITPGGPPSLKSSPLLLRHRLAGPAASSPRPMTRLDARRTSILGSSAPPSPVPPSSSPLAPSTHRDATPPSALRRPTPTTSRLRVRTQPAGEAGTAAPDPPDPDPRPLSRAATDYVRSRSRPRPRPARPSAALRSPGLRADFLLHRRAYPHGIGTGTVGIGIATGADLAPPGEAELAELAELALPRRRRAGMRGGGGGAGCEEEDGDGDGDADADADEGEDDADADADDDQSVARVPGRREARWASAAGQGLRFAGEAGGAARIGGMGVGVGAGRWRRERERERLGS